MEMKKNLVDVGKNQAKLEDTTEPALPYKDNKSKDEKGVAVDERPASFGSDAKETMPNSFEEVCSLLNFMQKFVVCKSACIVLLIHL
jgi:hypothetical protein